MGFARNNTLINQMKTSKETTLNNKLDTFLNELAKLVLLHANFSNDIGLYYGKTGAAMFLYHFEAYKENEIYYDFANEITLEIISSINDGNLNYTNGLSGVGWGINYLVRNDFIAIPADTNIFSNIDSKIIKSLLPVNLDTESVGSACYIHASLHQSSIIKQDLEYLLKEEKIIAFMEKMLSSLEAIKSITEKHFFHELKSMKNPVWINLIEKVAQIGVFIYKQGNHQLHPHLIEKIKEAYFLMSRKLLSFLFNLIIKEEQLLSAIYYDVRKMLFTLYSSYLQMPEHMDKVNLDNEFTAAIITLEDFFSASPYPHPAADVQALAALANIIGHVNHINYHRFFENILRNMLISYPDQKSLTTAFIHHTKELNIGVAGLSGLGLVILQYLSPEPLPWNESLLLN